MPQAQNRAFKGGLDLIALADPIRPVNRGQHLAILNAGGAESFLVRPGADDYSVERHLVIIGGPLVRRVSDQAGG